MTVPWPTTLATMATTLAAELKAAGVVRREEDAEGLSRRLVLAICRELGGVKLYIPLADFAAKAKRDAEIEENWKAGGASVAELARRHHVSETHVYRIISAYRRRMRRRGDG